MKSAFCFLFLIAASAAVAKPTRFEVKDAAFRNLLYFISEGSLEKTLGRTQFISGFIEVDPQDLGAGIKAELETDVRGFDLGSDSLQVKARETLFSADQFPGASFKAEKASDISPGILAPGKTATANIAGTIVFRGVPRNQTFPVKVSYWPASDKTRKRLPGNLLKVSSTFEMNLTHFQFSIPEELSGLLAPVLKVSMDLVATDQQPVTP
ncbi:YceI family protein [bacterium]|nr:YceI family protein [bacterium]